MNKYIKTVLLFSALSYSYFSNSQIVNKGIRCYALKGSYIINEKTEIIVPVRFINPQRRIIYLGEYINAGNDRKVECISTRYHVLYAKSKRKKYHNYVFDVHIEHLGPKGLRFSTPTKNVYAYIPGILHEKGFYKFKFSLYYMLKGKGKTYVLTTQWVNVQVL